jgi:hypothetical protein
MARYDRPLVLGCRKLRFGTGDLRHRRDNQARQKKRISNQSGASRYSEKTQPSVMHREKTSIV